MPSLAILIYGEQGSGRNAFTEEKYSDLLNALQAAGFSVQSVLYNDEIAEKLTEELTLFDAVLVWINPIENGKNRNRLDTMLREISEKGCFVSAHPDTILEMGTKDVLFKTRNMGWGSDVDLYVTFEDFKTRFPRSMNRSNIRVLKQYRGNGGNGVFKVMMNSSGDSVTVTHAKGGEAGKKLSWPELYREFKTFFNDNGLLIDQEWNDNLINGMVRCYVSGTNVAGFGYQEINAMCEINDVPVPAGRRYYFSENCGLFSDLKQVMENNWIPQLQEELSFPGDSLPLIWDADFFINKANSNEAVGKYTLCEINVSCVSPFPPSAIRFIVRELNGRINRK